MPGGDRAGREPHQPGPTAEQHDRDRRDEAERARKWGRYPLQRVRRSGERPGHVSAVKLVSLQAIPWISSRVRALSCI